MDELAKLDEAQYFLTRMREAEAAHDVRTFKYELSAFLSAARSVLQYAYVECERKARVDWYQAAVSHDPVLGFLKLQRDDNIHGRPAAPMEVTSHAVSADGSRSRRTEFFFVGWRLGTENAGELAEQCIHVLGALVAEGQAAGILTIVSPNYNVGDVESRAEARRRRTRGGSRRSFRRHGCQNGHAASCPRRLVWTRAPLRSLSPVFGGRDGWDGTIMGRSMRSLRVRAAVPKCLRTQQFLRTCGGATWRHSGVA